MQRRGPTAHRHKTNALGGALRLTAYAYNPFGVALRLTAIKQYTKNRRGPTAHRLGHELQAWPYGSPPYHHAEGVALRLTAFNQ